MAEWVCAYRLSFADGGDYEFGCLHVGTEDECRRTMDLIPAVAYGGSRPLVECIVFVAPRDEPEATA